MADNPPTPPPARRMRKMNNNTIRIAGPKPNSTLSKKLPDLIAQALAGNEVVITEHGKPVARLVAVPVALPRKKRVPGLNRGTIWTSEDFDEPLPDEFWLGQE